MIIINKMAYTINFSFRCFCIPKFGNRKFHKTDKLMMSAYLLPGAEKSLDGLRDSDYVACVKYREGDTQLFMSGGVEKPDMKIISDNEVSVVDAVVAEFSEEMRFKVESKNILLINKYQNKTFHSDTYVCNIDDMMATKKCNNREKQEIEGVKYKVTGVAYGNRKSIRKIISKMDRLDEHEYNDNIIGLVFIPVYDARKIVEIIRKNKKPFTYTFTKVKNNQIVPV